MRLEASARRNGLLKAGGGARNLFRFNSRLDALRKNRCAHSLRTLKRNKFRAPPPAVTFITLFFNIPVYRVRVVVSIAPENHEICMKKIEAIIKPFKDRKS